MRELLVLFYGNELSLGVVLGCWLFWTGIGSLLIGRLTDRVRSPETLFGVIQTILALSLIATLLALRSIRLFLDISPGEIVGYLTIFTASFTVLSIYCVLNGFLFSLGCRIYEKKQDSGLDRSSRGLGLIYILESVGAALGGLITSLILIRLFAPTVLIVGMGGINLIAAGVLFFSANRHKKIWIIKFFWSLLAGVYLLAVIVGGVEKMREMTLDWQWRGFELKKVDNTIYGNLAVTGRKNQFSLFENGLLVFTYPDLPSAENSVHFAMLEHPSPNKVMLIGGGVGGALREILRHPSVSEVTYLELDPMIIRLAREFMGPSEVRFLKNDRVKTIIGDGRLYLEQEQKKYDLIIINLPDPFTAQINRFYTREFFTLAQSRLRPGGILSVGLTSSENYISGELRNFLGCIYKTLKDVFPALVVIPGGSNYFLASDLINYLTDDYTVIEARSRERNLNLKYVRSYYLSDRMQHERIEYLRSRIESAPRIRLNLDFHPICYFYDMIFWSSYFSGETGGWFPAFLNASLSMRWWWFLFPIGLVLIIFPFLRRRRFQSRGAWVLWPVMTSGFAEIVFQVVVLLSFQILYGYVYYKLGIIITLFMIGLVMGAGAVTANFSRIRNEQRLFLKTQIVICLYPLILPLVMVWLAQSPGKTMIWFSENVIFPALPLVAGFIGGFQLPLAGRIYLRARKRMGLVAGLTYGFDLIGACLGAVCISAVILPILGVAATCYAVFFINMTSLIIILGYYK